MRTFIAIDLPLDLKQQLVLRQQEFQRALRPLGIERELRWTTLDKMHLTLRFLGETTSLQREKIVSELDARLRDQRTFCLRLYGLGAFPTWLGMRVLWTGVDGERTQLEHLQAKVEQIAQGAGFPAETRSFSPHITLARVERNTDKIRVRRLGEFMKTWAEKKDSPYMDSWLVDELIYMESDLRPSGAVYTPLAKIDFA